MDLLSIRGEFLNAKLMAEYLGYQFVDESHQPQRRCEWRQSRTSKKSLIIYNKIVIPGFYGSLPNNVYQRKYFPRRLRRIRAYCTSSFTAVCTTGPMSAASLMSRSSHSWKPKEHRPRYAELRELSYMGAAVLHEDVRAKDIPINIQEYQRTW